MRASTLPGGKTTLPSVAAIGALGFLPSGALVLGGRDYNTNNVDVAQLHPDGTLDSAFGIVVNDLRR